MVWMAASSVCVVISAVGEYAEGFPPLYPNTIAWAGVSLSAIWMSLMVKKCRSRAECVTGAGEYPAGIRSSRFSYPSPSPYFQVPYPYSE